MRVEVNEAAPPGLVLLFYLLHGDVSGVEHPLEGLELAPLPRDGVPARPNDHPPCLRVEELLLEEREPVGQLDDLRLARVEFYSVIAAKYLDGRLDHDEMLLARVDAVAVIHISPVGLDAAHLGYEMVDGVRERNGAYLVGLAAESEPNVTPVSYTHLDVYKRQG